MMPRYRKNPTRESSDLSAAGNTTLSSRRNSTRSTRSQSSYYPSSVEDQSERGLNHSSHDDDLNAEDDVINSSMIGRATSTRSSSDFSEYNDFSPAFRDSGTIEGAAVSGFLSSEEEKGEEEKDSKRDYWDREESAYFHRLDAKNVKHSSKNKCFHSPSVGSGDIDDTEESKTSRSGRGRGSFKGGHSRKKECAKVRGKTKAKSIAKNMSSRRKAEDDTYLTDLIGGRDANDDEKLIATRIQRSQSTTSMLRKASSHSDAVSAKKKMVRKTKERSEGIRRKGRGSTGGFDDEWCWPCPHSVKQGPEVSSSHEGGAGNGSSTSPSSPEYADTVLLNSIRKQDKRPLDEHVKKARMILAKALRSGEKSVRLSGLCLRYPQNITALLNDAAQALEHGIKVPNAGNNPDFQKWFVSWGQELKVVELSRNNLDGIEPLLMVKPHSPEGVPKESGSGCVYPLSGVIELGLNGNNMRKLPPDMHLTLPKLEKLEMYGNILVDIVLPKTQLPHMKHLNLGNNKLLDLPAEICDVMPNLEDLLLSLNELESLPDSIAGMRHLKRLDVCQNPLISPPLEVAARGVDAVKRYFRDIETQDRADGEVPNQLKVIFLGHSDTGKSKLVDCLSTPVPPGVAETKQEERCETPPGTPVMKRQSVNTFVSPKPSLMTAISAGGYAPGPLHDGQQASTRTETTEDIDMDIRIMRPTPTLTLRRRSSEETVDWDARKAAGEDPSLFGGKDDITLKLWDFGGTEDFHVVHGLFFSRRALYTVVFDLRHVESDVIDKRVQFWVDCIQTRVTGARILLVGTHADKFNEADAKERCNQVLQQILNNEKAIVRGLKSGGKGSQSARKLSHPNSRPKIVNKVLAVSISPDNIQGLEAFREQVLKLAKDRKDFPTSRLPPAWFEIDRFVKQRRSRGHSIMHVDEIVEEFTTNSPEDMRNTVVSTLNWLNDTSEVVYFDKPQLNHFVILHPMHLMKAIKLIVSFDLRDKVKNLISYSLEAQYRNGETCTPSNAVIAPNPPNASVSFSTPVQSGSSQPSTIPNVGKSSPTPEAERGYERGSGKGDSNRKPRRKRRGGKKQVPMPQGPPTAAKTPSAASIDYTAEGVSTGGGGSIGLGGGSIGLGGGSTGLGGGSTGLGGGSTGLGGGSTGLGGGSTRGQRGGRRRMRGSRQKVPVTGANRSSSPRSSMMKTPSSQSQKPYIHGQKQKQKQSGKGGTSKPGGAMGRQNSLSNSDETNLNKGFVTHEVVKALLEPSEEMVQWDDRARDFFIRLLQESCVLVEVQAKTPKVAGSRRGFVGGVGKDRGKDELPPAIPGSLPPDIGTISRSSSKGTTSDKEGGKFYFIPCILPKRPPKWRFDRVVRVHCGRRWTFHRFVPPSLMSLLICRFYEMGDKGSATLCRGSITIEVQLPFSSKGSDKQKKVQDKSPPTAELLLRMFPGQQAPQDTLRCRKPSRLELWAQVNSRHQKQLMQSLEFFVKVVDNTLAEFPGLLVFRRVPCPACMDEKPRASAIWGDLPLEEVERYRSNLADLPTCANNCTLREWQKKLMFVGDLPPETGATDGHMWDSPLPELGSGIPKVSSLFPAVCPIAVYDCLEQRVLFQATAFVVDAVKGYLLTAAHTFGTLTWSSVNRKASWKTDEECPKETCIVLVAMLQPPYQYDTKWEFVADAVHHSAKLREEVYDDICWKKDHPVLLRIKCRFEPVSTRIISGLPFAGITDEGDWRRSSLRDGLIELSLGESRIFHQPSEGAHYMTVYPKALMDMLHSLGDEDIQMSMSVFPQELLILIAFPEHLRPHYSSISVTHGPVARNLVGDDVIEVLLSNHDGASGGPVVNKKGKVVGILSQGNSVSAYVMGISTAKTLLRAEQSELDEIYNLDPLLRKLH